MVQVSAVLTDTDAKAQLYATSVQEKVGTLVSDSKSCVLIATYLETTTEVFLAMGNADFVTAQASANLAVATDISSKYCEIEYGFIVSDNVQAPELD